MDAQNKSGMGFLDDEMIRKLLLEGDPQETMTNSNETSNHVKKTLTGAETIPDNKARSECLESVPSKDGNASETFGDEGIPNIVLEESLGASFPNYLALDKTVDVEIGSEIEMQTDKALERNVIQETNDNLNECQKSKEIHTENDTTSEIRTGNNPGPNENESFDFLCPECQKGFSHKTLLKKHIQKHHPSLRPFVCNLCTKSFPTSSGLKQHLGTHETAKLFTCYICFAQYKQKGGLINHEKQCHSSTQSAEENSDISQDTSAKTSDYSEVFQQFLSQPKSARAKNELSAGKPYTCPICQGSFRGKYHLSNHMLRHSEDSPYKCQYCAKVFTCQKDVRRHLFVHTKEYAEKYLECGKLFASKSDLTKHMITHTKQYPVYCDICQKGWVNNRELRRHRETHETTKVCDVCQKEFKNHRGFRNHLKTHGITDDLDDDLKVHVCSQTGCDRRFKVRGPYDSHFMRNDRIQ